MKPIQAARHIINNLLPEIPSIREIQIRHKLDIENSFDVELIVFYRTKIGVDTNFSVYLYDHDTDFEIQKLIDLAINEIRLREGIKVAIVGGMDIE